MSVKIIRSIATFSLIIIAGGIAGCNSTDTGGALSLGDQKAQTKADPAQVIVQGACPQVYLREGTAFHSVFAKGAKIIPGGKPDPEKLRYEATLSQTTRECRQTAEGLVVTVVAYGRLISGPQGAPGSVTMPIRVAASDGDTTVYTELSQYEVVLPQGQGSAQFIFSKNDVLLPGGIGPLTKLFVGFDEGPYKTKK